MHSTLEHLNIKQGLTEVKVEIDSNILTVGNLNTLL